MKNTTIICPHCNREIDISDAIRHQIEDELSRAKSEQTAVIRKEIVAETDSRVKRAVEDALAKAYQDAELRLAKERQAAAIELAKARQGKELAVNAAVQTNEFEIAKLRGGIAASAESEKKLRAQLAQLIEELSNANKAKEDAGLAARKELLEKEKIIREEAVQRASEGYTFKLREKDEQLSRLREQLTAAKQTAELSSQQLQGEILEIDMEKALNAHFPFDTISEVKKGERGSDIRQVVNDKFCAGCGLILWECKNAKTFQQGWVTKLKDEMAVEKAGIGVIVFQPTDGGGDDFKQIESNLWVVKPRLAVMLATSLRTEIIKVFITNRNARGKGQKAEMVYDYLMSEEFGNRIRYILEAYDEMAKDLEQEKKQAAKRWAAQEKRLQKVTRGIYGMSGDLQGIAGRDIIALSGNDITESESAAGTSEKEGSDDEY
ncbi:MAG: DUF2130 domain-containing protein [Clostridiales bacterium]|jgi:hypothetical protein|nr:DUF2130 domain-containing protein [Clostridiales bacterium]